MNTMNNMDDVYPNKIFEYSYPYTWEERNKNYLKVVTERSDEQDYQFPVDDESID